MIRPQFHNEDAVAAGHCVQALLANPKMRKATKFIDPKNVVKATRQRKYDGRDRQTTFLVTVGKPNYEERRFIKDCAATGTLLPHAGVQLKPYPKKREH